MILAEKEADGEAGVVQVEGEVEVEVEAAVVEQIEVAATVYMERLVAEAEVEYIQVAGVLPFDPFDQPSCQPMTSPSIVY